jgi:peptide/nickel transport system permease protein
MTPRETWRRFRRSRLALLALLYVVAVALIALFAPLLASSRPLILRTPSGIRFPAAADFFGEREGREQTLQGRVILRAPIHYSPNELDVLHRVAAPFDDHHFGTDDLGRDVLARIIHGARVSLSVGLLATAISLLVGALLGAVAGYYGGAIDWIVSRAIELVLCFPLLFLVLGIVALFRPSMLSIVIAIAITSWTGAARFVRGEVLRVRELDFAQAARAIGARDPRLIFRHLLPNAIAPALVSASFGIADAVLTESALSFIGLGVPLPAASWGGILSVAELYIDYAWWLVLFPGLAIFSTVAAFNIVGDRFREVLDPRAE